MTENKNLLEELREHETESCATLAKFGGKRCIDFGNCSECRAFGFGCIADRIEKEFVPISQLSDCFPLSSGFQWPLYEDGTPVKFGDEFVTDTGKSSYLTSLELSCGDCAKLNVGAVCEEERLTLEKGDRVKRVRSKEEILDRIAEDAAKDPREYCAEILDWDLGDIITAEHDDMRQAMIEDLLRRQREVLTREEN